MMMVRREEGSHARLENDQAGHGREEEVDRSARDSDNGKSYRQYIYVDSIGWRKHCLLPAQIKSIPLTYLLTWAYVLTPVLNTY